MNARQQVQAFRIQQASLALKVINDALRQGAEAKTIGELLIQHPELALAVGLLPQVKRQKLSIPEAREFWEGQLTGKAARPKRKHI